MLKLLKTVVGATEIKVKAPTNGLATLMGPLADSLSVQAFEPSTKLLKTVAGGPTSRFDDVLAGAFASYREADDVVLQAARKAQVRPSTAAFAKLTAAAITEDPMLNAVSTRLEAMPLTEKHKSLLTGGVAYRFGPAQEPLVRPIQAVIAADTLSRMPATAKARVQAMLDGSENDIERALILKSLGPRRNQLLAAGPEAGKALQEVENYAGIIRGAPTALLLERTTILGTNEYGELISLQQQHHNACVASSSLGCMATADPFIAWVLKADGPINGLRVNGLAARLERAILTSDVTGERGEHWDIPASFGNVRKDVRAVLDAGEQKAGLTREDRLAVLRLLKPSKRLDALGLANGAIDTPAEFRLFQKILADFPKNFPQAQAVIDRLKASGAGELDGRQLLELGQSNLQDPKGVAPDHIANIFLKPKTQLDYNRVKYLYRLEADPSHGARLAQVVEAGQPVLLRRGDPEDVPENYSHCLTALCVRTGAAGTREVLIPDTYHGRAKWFSQAQFDSQRAQMSYFFGQSSPKLGVGRAATGRPEL